MSYAQNRRSFESTTSYATLWSNTDWNKTRKYVDKQQRRIYRAESNNDKRKVRDLQRMLVRSSAALKLAIKRVTQINKGKKTPGLDGFRAVNDKQRGELFVKMRNMNINLHKPKPAYRIHIPKKNNKTRPLSIPVIIDRVYQELLRMALEPQWEFKFEPISYGFRPKRRAHDAMERIFYNVKNGNWCWVFEGDFKSCFDTLDHNFILKQIEGFPYVNVVEKFLKAGYVDNNVFFRTKIGTPQGGLLSPLLANIALTGMEDCLGISYNKLTRKNGSTTYNAKGNYRMTRYADDFVIFAKSKEEIEKVYDILNPYLEERGLILAEDKTRITHISEGFDFLGFETRQRHTKDGDKCFIKPSKDSLKNARTKIAERFELMKGHNVGDLIDALNPLIIGLVNYWKPMVSTVAFEKMDNYIWIKVKKFLKHLHPKKGWKWIRRKYFPDPKPEDKHQDRWILTDPVSGRQLVKMRWTSIDKRHIMIKHNYSPFDSDKSEYFKNRQIKLSN